MRLAASCFALALALALPAATAVAQEEARTFENWQDAAALIRDAGEYHSEAVGEGGDKSDIYRAYEFLRDRAPVEVQRKLLEDRSAAVRAYALRALVERRRGDDHVALLKDLAPRRDPLTTMFGCIVQDEALGDVVVGEVAPLLREAEQRKFVTWMLVDGPRTPARRQLLHGYPFTEQDLPALRRLADSGDAAALVALSALRSADDVPRITSALVAAAGDVDRLRAVCVAAERHGGAALCDPLAALAPRIAKQLARERPARFRPWIDAVARHDTKAAAVAFVTFLDAPIAHEHDRELRAQFVFEAVRDKTSPVYDPVHTALWTNDRMADLAALRRLHARAPKRVLAAAEALLAKPLDGRGSIASTLDLLREHRPAAAEAALVRHLPTMTWQHAEALCRRAAQWKPEAAIVPLMQLYLDSDDNLIYQPVARALLCYDRPGLDATVRDHIAEKEDPFGHVEQMLKDLPRTWAER